MNPNLHSKLKLTFLGQKDSDNGGKKINGEHTQTYLPTSPNNSDKQTTASTGKNKAKQKLQPSSYLVKIKSIKKLQGS